MEILIAVASKTAEYLVEPIVNPIKRRASLIVDCETKVKDLRNASEDLVSMRKNVEEDVEIVGWSSNTIKVDVLLWLKDVQRTDEEVQAWLGAVPPQPGKRLGWRVRYKLSQEAMLKKDHVDALLRDRNKFQRLHRPESPKGIKLVSRRKFTTYPSVTETFNTIIQHLRKDGTNKVAVLGMGGIGKTTLVKEVGTVAQEVKLFDKVVMAVISQNPDIRAIQGQLGDMLGLKYSTESNAGRSGQLSIRLQKEKSVLVILDDVWKAINLSDIGIPCDGAQGSCKVLLTTRREDVCTSMDCQETVPMKLLDEGEAIILFNKYAGKILDGPTTDEFEEVARQVIAKCDGLPLALALMASALKVKPIEAWSYALETLKMAKFPEIEDVDRNVYACIKLSYDFLKANVTKRCFLLCALFPEDSEIRPKELAKYAVGYGMYDDYDGVNTFVQAKERIEIVLDDLKASCLLLRTDLMRNVKMHDVVRDAALWIASNTDDGLKELFIVPSSLQYDWTRNTRLAEVTAVSLLACPMAEQLPHQAQCPSLKILLMAQRTRLTLSDTCFRGMTALRVLDLTAKEMLELTLPSSLELLINLRTLLLRRWILRGRIGMIGSLRSLEILSFSGCALPMNRLPAEIGQLSELRFLDLSGCTDLAPSYYDVMKNLTCDKVHLPATPMDI